MQCALKASVITADALPRVVGAHQEVPELALVAVAAVQEFAVVDDAAADAAAIVRVDRGDGLFLQRGVCEELCVAEEAPDVVDDDRERQAESLFKLFLQNLSSAIGERSICMWTASMTMSMRSSQRVAPVSPGFVTVFDATMLHDMSAMHVEM